MLAISPNAAGFNPRRGYRHLKTVAVGGADVRIVEGICCPCGHALGTTSIENRDDGVISILCGACHQDVLIIERRLCDDV